MDLKGIAEYTGRPFTIEEMNESVTQFLGVDDARIKREYSELVARSQVPADKGSTFGRTIENDDPSNPKSRKTSARNCPFGRSIQRSIREY